MLPAGVPCSVSRIIDKKVFRNQNPLYDSGLQDKALLIQLVPGNGPLIQCVMHRTTENLANRFCMTFSLCSRMNGWKNVQISH